jgi:hypothetical protein
MPPEPAPAYQMDFFRALLCRPHRHGIFGRDRCRDLDEGALSNDGASTGAATLHAAIGIDRALHSRQKPDSPAPS